MNTTTEIEQLLDAYDVQKSISLKSLADQIIEKYPPSNLSFSTLNLPVKLHIGEMEYLTFIDTNQTIYTFLQDISNYYDLPSTLHIGIPFLLDCIYHSRKFSSFILFPHQDIYIVHQDPTITLNPSPKQHIPSTFPWSKFSKIFSPLLLSSSDANVQVFRIISSLPLSEFTFTDISQPVELLASNFQVLLPPQQITVCSQDQALSLIQLSLKLNKKAKFFSLFSALKLCILYKATLSLPFLERIKNEVKGEPEERNMCIYLGVLSSPSLRSPLTKLTNHVFPQLLHYARDEILMVEPEDIPEVIEGIAEYITKPPKDKTTLIDLFTTPFSYSQSSDAPFSENPMAYAPLLLLDKLVSTYGFCVVTPDLGKILMAFAFPQWRNIYPTSIPLGGPQTINIACKMIAKAPNTRKVFAQYFMETSNIQLNAPKIELSSFPVVQAPNDDDIHFILLTLHLISDAGLYTYANILNSLYSYPCRCVDATFLANKLGGYKSSPRVFKEFLSKEKISIDYYSTSNNITPEKLISVLKGNTYQYVLCEFISTQQFDVQSNTISESYDIIAVVLSNGEYLLHKNKAWFIITKTFLRQLSQREEKRFLSKHIQYIIIKTSKNNNSNFPNNEPSTVSVADVALRSSPYAIDCFELQTTLELFPNLISRYIKFSTSIMFRTILQRLNEFNDPKSVITSLSSKKFINVLNSADDEDLNTIIIDFLINEINKLEIIDIGDLIDNLNQLKKQKGLMKLYEHCLKPTTSYVIESHLNELWNHVEDDKNTFEAILSKLINSNSNGVWRSIINHYDQYVQLNISKENDIYKKFSSYNAQYICDVFGKNLSLKKALNFNSLHPNYISVEEFKELNDIDQSKVINKLDKSCIGVETLYILHDCKSLSKKLETQTLIQDVLEQASNNHDERHFYWKCVDKVCC